MTQIEKQIATIRNAHPDMVDLFTNGQCYNFFLILKSIHPQAKALYSHLEGHVYVEIDEKVYDIRGRRYKLPSDIAPLNFKQHDKPHRWGSRDNRRLTPNQSKEP